MEYKKEVLQKCRDNGMDVRSIPMELPILSNDNQFDLFVNN